MTPAVAARHVLTHCAPLEPLRRPLREAVGLVLAEDVTSPLDLPPADNSGMDGYAVRLADVRGATRERPVSLRVLETVAAGQVAEHAVLPGTAVRVFTGVSLPAGADCVIRQEDTTLAGDALLVLQGSGDPPHVRRRGEDVRRGDRVLATGSVLGPAALGLLAAVAHGTPLVHRPPRVAFFGSGDELAELDRRDDIVAGRKIATANSYTLFASIREAGGIPTDLGLARDTPESVRQRFLEALDADLIVTTGGVSVGAHDCVRGVVEALGGRITLWRVRMRPGAPLAVGSLFGKPWIGLPGNPVSTMVTFELFVRPAIRRLLGHGAPFRRAVAVALAEPVSLGPALRHFLRAVVLEEERGVLRARLTGPQGSGILTSMARANALLIVPEERRSLAAGMVVDALLLGDPRHVVEPPF